MSSLMVSTSGDCGSVDQPPTSTTQDIPEIPEINHQALIDASEQTEINYYKTLQKATRIAEHIRVLLKDSKPDNTSLARELANAKGSLTGMIKYGQQA